MTSAETCAATTKAGNRCQALGLKACGYCFMHDPETTPEMLSAAGRLGAQSTNHKASLKAIERRQKALAGKEEAALATLKPAEQALVTLWPASVDLSDPKALEVVLSRVAAGIFDGTLPPARAKALVEVVRARTELGSLEISKKLVEIEKHLDAQRGTNSPTRGRKR